MTIVKSFKQNNRGGLVVVTVRESALSDLTTDCLEACWLSMG